MNRLHVAGRPFQQVLRRWILEEDDASKYVDLYARIISLSIWIFLKLEKQHGPQSLGPLFKARKLAHAHLRELHGLARLRPWTLRSSLVLHPRLPNRVKASPPIVNKPLSKCYPSSAITSSVSLYVIWATVRNKLYKRPLFNSAWVLPNCSKTFLVSV